MSELLKSELRVIVNTQSVLQKNSTVICPAPEHFSHVFIECPDKSLKYNRKIPLPILEAISSLFEFQVCSFLKGHNIIANSFIIFICLSLGVKEHIHSVHMRAREQFA